MGFLKRKRSESEFSSSSSWSSLSPVRPDNFSFTCSSMPIDTTMGKAMPHARMPSHLPSRTLKRFRNSRPSEQQVHEHTLGMLYAARHEPEQTPSQHCQAMSPPADTPTSSSTSHGQKSLHAFWNISLPASTTTTLPQPVNKAALSLLDTRTDCEDCGVPVNGRGDDNIMAIDGLGSDAASSTGCVSCGKLVCSSCSVSNLGAEQRCLVCAGREGRKEPQRAGRHELLWHRLGVC